MEVVSRKPPAKPRIDPQFSELCPRLSDDEYALLEASLRKGYRDTEPIRFWPACPDCPGAIIDGHHRWEICGLIDVTPKLKAIEFSSREEAVNWIVDNQLGRRNLTPDQVAYLRGKKYEMKKGPGHGKKKTGYQNNTQHEGRVRDSLAKDFGVSADTIQRDAKFAKAVDRLTDAHGQEVKGKILSGKSGLTKMQVVATAKLPTHEQQAVLNGTGMKPRATVQTRGRHKGKGKHKGTRTEHHSAVEEIESLLRSIITSLVKRNGSAEALKNLKLARKLVGRAKSQLNLTGVES